MWQRRQASRTFILVSPDNPAHLIEVKPILKRLQFHAFNARFDCTREELIKLGKRADNDHR